MSGFSRTSTTVSTVVGLPRPRGPTKPPSGTHDSIHHVIEGFFFHFIERSASNGHESSQSCLKTPMRGWLLAVCNANELTTRGLTPSSQWCSTPRQISLLPIEDLKGTDVASWRMPWMYTVGAQKYGTPSVQSLSNILHCVVAARVAHNQFYELWWAYSSQITTSVLLPSKWPRGKCLVS